MPTVRSTTTSPRRRAREIDESRWPLVIVTFHGAATDEEYEVYLKDRTTLLLRREMHAVLLDASACGPMPPSQRKLQAEWQRQQADLGREYTLGTAFLFTSPMVRGILTAVLWLQPLSYPHHVASTWLDAERWAIERIRAAGLPAPPARAIKVR